MNKEDNWFKKNGINSPWDGILYLFGVGIFLALCGLALQCVRCGGEQVIEAFK